MPLKTIKVNEQEVLVARHCGLQHNKKTIGPDAYDIFNNPFELKSGTKLSITTGRSVSLRTISLWRKRYWLIASGDETEDGLKIAGLYIVHPGTLGTRFSKMEKQLKSDWEKCKKILNIAKKSKISKVDLSRIEKILDRGIRLNNHKIPLKIFKDHGTQINHKNKTVAKKQIKTFVKNNPLSSK